MPPTLPLELCSPNAEPVIMKTHPCAFYSHRLTPSEQNYDVGSRELLTFKLEEWRHWPEGASVPHLD